MCYDNVLFFKCLTPLSFAHSSVIVLTLGIFFFTYATSAAASKKATEMMSPATRPSYSFLAGGQCCEDDAEEHVTGKFGLP